MVAPVYKLDHLWMDQQKQASRVGGVSIHFYVLTETWLDVVKKDTKRCVHCEPNDSALLRAFTASIGWTCPTCHLFRSAKNSAFSLTNFTEHL